MTRAVRPKPGNAPGPRSGRRLPGEMRPIHFRADYIRTAPGSCLIEVGHTRVLCTATVDERVPPHKKESGDGWVTAEYAMLPGSGSTRVPRDRARGGRSMEIQRLVGRSMRSVVDLAKLGARTIYIDCDVLQADGGTRCAAVTGGYVALARALAALARRGELAGNPLTGAVAAVSVGIVRGAPFLDLDYGEDAEAEVDMNVVMTDKGRFVELQGTAEKAAFGKRDLDRLLRLAGEGIARLLELQAKHLPST
ncbi:MAG: ribonuclease PH [Candidatus Tectomicrobia bacterium]|nr:ribonuclease PH [Candidatus Tectomicrobia bacterium]